ncbi:MAG: hypothetical protein CR988_07030 [Treponema sp.]|nr:MAG: hypothetical protein CR988_07030 [Treponema sp.]
MGIRGEVFTTQIQAENRTYFFNVKENTRGDVFLQIVESKSTEGTGFDRHAIVVFEEELRQFMTGFDDSLRFMEKYRRAKSKKTRSVRTVSKDRQGDVKREKPVNRDTRNSIKVADGNNRASLFKKKPRVKSVKKK